MPPKKSQNTKGIAAKEKKAAHEDEVNKKKMVEKEAKDASEWSVGAKSAGKKEAEAAKKAEAAAKKAEAARLLAEEEKEFAKSKPLIRPAKGEEKKALKKSEAIEAVSAVKREVPEFSASNIDDALDLLTIATSDGATVKGQKEIERHPERRFKAALAAYEERYGVGGNGAILIDWMVDTLSSVDVECLYFNFICLGRTRYSVLREMEKMKKEFPGLRRNQLKELIFKNFQKSEENPFNQAVIQYNAERSDEAELIDKRRNEIENRLRST